MIIVNKMTSYNKLSKRASKWIYGMS